MLENLKKYNIILASASPRRSELLRNIGIDFQIMPLDVDENIRGEFDFSKLACELALRKSDAFPAEQWTSETLLITADTIVVQDDAILGKPNNREEAIEMLRLLSGNEHLVITGLCIKTLQKQVIECSSTRVYFSVLTKDEIDHYVDYYKPYDKAGAYGIQEWIGSIGIEKIEGSYFNVVGLPTRKLYEILKDF